MCKKGYCIICHQDNQELSDEHVIPEAIGGYYHIYNVCKDCNSKLGDHVDNLLLNHWFIKAARHEKGFKGYKGYIPNPLVGEGLYQLLQNFQTMVNFLRYKSMLRMKRLYQISKLKY